MMDEPAMTESRDSAILITGATGNIGRELCKTLCAQNVSFRAMVRPHNGELATRIDGAKVVAGDFNDERSIAEALEGVDQAFLLTNSSELAEVQQVTFVDVAKRAGVKNIVKLSQWAADPDSPVRFLR